MMLQAVNYLCILGAAHIQHAPLPYSQHSLYLGYLQPEKKSYTDYLLSCGRAGAVKYLIAVIPVDIDATDKIAALHSLFLKTLYYILAECRRRVFINDLHIKTFGSSYHLFYIRSFYVNHPIILIVYRKIPVHIVNDILYLRLGKAVALHAGKAIESDTLKCVSMTRKLIVVNIKLLDIAACQR